jgi:hypothetical protein
MLKFSERQLNECDKINAIDGALTEIGLDTMDVVDTIKEEAVAKGLKINTICERDKQPGKQVILTEYDREFAVKKRLVPEIYKDVKFDEGAIRRNLVEQHKKAQGIYKIYHFKDYIGICNEILTTIRAGKLPRRSWIIGAPNGFGKTSFVNECLITMLKQGWITAPYVSLSELATIRVSEEQRLMRPFSYKTVTGIYSEKEQDFMSEKQHMTYMNGISSRDIVKNPIFITNGYSWSEYMNASCLFVSFTDVVSKDLESHVLYQLLNIRGIKGLPTIAMISTSLDPYMKDLNLRELVWNEILDYDDKDNYDRVKHVSCYKNKKLSLDFDEKMDKDTGIINE